jgi:hypothetical protein
VSKLFLSLHVLAAIIAIGPVTVAASMFPAAARRAWGRPADPGAASSLRLLHRVCRVYALVAVVVPVFGFATAGSLHVTGDGWVIGSIALTALAALVLGLVVLPGQRGILATAPALPAAASVPSVPSAPAAAGPATAVAGALPATTVASARPDPRLAARLAMATGVFNLLWAAVTVIMIVRPGSTTGV